VQTSSGSSDGNRFKGVIRRILVAIEVEKVQAWLANWLTALRLVGTINS